MINETREHSNQPGPTFWDEVLVLDVGMENVAYEEEAASPGKFVLVCIQQIDGIAFGVVGCRARFTPEVKIGEEKVHGEV